MKNNFARIFIAFLTLSFFLTAFRAEANEADKIRVGVLQFESKASGVTQQQADAVMDLLVRSLSGSKTIAVFERSQLKETVGKEVRLGQSGLVDPSTAAELGKVAGVQYILLGAVTELSSKASGGAIPIYGSLGIATGSEEARTTIDVRVIDTSTGAIHLALSEQGSSKSEVSGLTIAGAVLAEGTFGGLEGRAIEDAVMRLAWNIRSELGGESSHVLSVDSKSARIDIGSSTGAKEGSVYLVYMDGETIRGMDGEIVGRERVPLAILKAKDVSYNYSTCTIVTGSKSSMIERGDKIVPITRAKAKGIKLASKRPARARFSEYDEFLSGGDSSASVAKAPSIDDRLSEIAQEQESSKPSEEPAPSKQPTHSEEPPSSKQPQPTPKKAAKKAGFDPNTSTDSKVIQTYDLPSGQKNIIGIKHRTAYNNYRAGQYSKAFKMFVEAAEAAPEANYLSAYWAGVTAHKRGKKDESLAWINKALEINPNYEPAQTFKTKTLKK
ncbi:MAG: hypothetical protein GX256_05730 [Fretibacterium sp.]|nr:hypothetical protein [Fretibacterium sp.]